jgi:hypothetical protein
VFKPVAKWEWAAGAHELERAQLRVGLHASVRDQPDNVRFRTLATCRLSATLTLFEAFSGCFSRFILPGSDPM